jgi:hypothetical protein
MAAGKKRARLGIRRKATAQETVMADLTTAEKAPILIDGEHVNADTPMSSTDESVVSIGGDTAGKAYAIANAAGSSTILAAYGGRSGSLDVTVTAAPLVITLGPAQPK